MNDENLDPKIVQLVHDLIEQYAEIYDDNIEDCPHCLAEGMFDQQNISKIQLEIFKASKHNIPEVIAALMTQTRVYHGLSVVFGNALDVVHELYEKEIEESHIKV